MFRVWVSIGGVGCWIFLDLVSEIGLFGIWEGLKGGWGVDK